MPEVKQALQGTRGYYTPQRIAEMVDFANQYGYSANSEERVNGHTK